MVTPMEPQRNTCIFFNLFIQKWKTTSFSMQNLADQGDVAQYNESSTYLMGWLRDYLWMNSPQLINSYNPFGMNSLFCALFHWSGTPVLYLICLIWQHEKKAFHFYTSYQIKKAPSISLSFHGCNRIFFKFHGQEGFYKGFQVNRFGFRDSRCFIAVCGVQMFHGLWFFVQF